MVPNPLATSPQSTVRSRPRWPLLLIGVAAVWLLTTPTGFATDRAPADRAELVGLTLSFVPNVGQAEPGVLFEGRLFGPVVQVTADAIAFADGRRLTFGGTGGAAGVRGVEPLPGVVNFLLGNDPRSWRTNVPTYGRLRLENLYPGVALELSGAPHGLRFTLDVAPGGSADRIAWRIDGADGSPAAPLQPGGELDMVLALDYGSYLGGGRDDSAMAVAADGQGNAYITGSTQSSNFPRQGPLQPDLGSGSVADAFVTKVNPAGDALVYSTYLGGNRGEHGYDIALDAQGSAYVVGYTESNDFPRAAAIQDQYGGGGSDGFIAVLSPDGSQMSHGSFIGGRDSDNVTGVAVGMAGASQGRIYLTGDTSSTDFPTVNPLQNRPGGRGDAYVAVIAPDRSAYTYSTYLGGSSAETGMAIATDASGAAYVTGYSLGSGFPLENPIQSNWRGVSDVFVTKLVANGAALEYSTYLGGRDEDQAEGITVANGEVTIAGHTLSRDYPIEAAYQGQIKGDSDAFITRIAADGSAIVFSTFLGGAAGDMARDVVLDAAGNVHVAGSTSSTNFPTLDPIQNSLRGLSDAMVASLSADGQTLLFGTYFGGSREDYARGVALGPQGSLIITGYTESADLKSSGGFQENYGSQGDAFVARMSLGAIPTPQATNTPTSTVTPTRRPVTATSTVPPTGTLTATATLSSATPTQRPPTATVTVTPTATPTEVEEYRIYLPVLLKK